MSKFKVGDRVRSVRDVDRGTIWDGVMEVITVDHHPCWPIDVATGDGFAGSYAEDELELA